MTNFEKIKAMGCDEFAEFLAKIIDTCGYHVENCPLCPLYGAGFCDHDDIVEWLESEAKTDGD